MNDAVKLPWALAANRRLSQWLRFDDDRSVTLITGRVELGQGILTALMQIAAEELDVDFARMRVLSGDTAVVPNEGVTSGSRSINEGGMAVRYACAEARQIMVDEASRRLGIAADKLTVKDGVICPIDGGAELSYWDLPYSELLDCEATGSAPLKSPERYTIVGTSVARIDLPDKITGRPRFVQDIELPGMLFGRAVRPPSLGAELVEFDAEAVAKLPGVVTVVRDGNFIGVVAEREEQAIKAQQTATTASRWREVGLPVDDVEIYDFLETHPSRETVLLETSDAAAQARAERRIEARYTKPYLSHGSIGPACAVARIENGQIEAWSPTQGVWGLRKELALILDMELKDVRIHHTEGAGCYGHNGNDDVVLDAVLLSRAVAGRPVKVQWMRDDDFAWEPYGPAMLVRMQGALDGAGNIVDWHHDVWSNGHMHRPSSVETTEKVSSLIASWHLANPIPRMPQIDPPGGLGMANNAIPGAYDFPNQRIATHFVFDTPLRASSVRSLGGFTNIFALESFMDEMAIAAGVDPVEFRLRHVKDPRARAVIELAAQKANWRPGTVSDGSHGRGFAYGRYKNAAGYLAIAVDIEIDQNIRVSRVVAAMDVGQVINPSGVLNQNEGAIIQAISWTLKEQIRFDHERVTSRTWEEYPILTFPEVPQIEIHLIDRPGELPLGAGETGVGPTGAAVANAVHNALGVRIRDLPITPERVAAALA